VLSGKRVVRPGITRVSMSRQVTLKNPRPLIPCRVLTQQLKKTRFLFACLKSYPTIIFQGDVDKHDFLAFYVKDSRILAVAGMNRDRDMAIWEERIRNDRILSPDQLSDGPAEFQNNSVDSSSFSALRLL